MKGKTQNFNENMMLCGSLNKIQFSFQGNSLFSYFPGKVDAKPS